MAAKQENILSISERPFQEFFVPFKMLVGVDIEQANNMTDCHLGLKSLLHNGDFSFGIRCRRHSVPINTSTILSL